MHYNKFTIQNFKGIQSLDFDLSMSPHSPVYVFVGLNESGKTTILESLAFFYDNLGTEREPKIRPKVVGDIHDLIPKGKRDNFNDKIVLRCTVTLEDKDIDLIQAFLKKSGVTLISQNNTFYVEQQYSFQDSKYKSRQNIWSTEFLVSAVEGEVENLYTYRRPLWQQTMNYIETIIPPLVYYPNFFFDFRDRIYLEPQEGEEDTKQTFYRRVLQDVLDSMNNGLNIDTHIISRLKNDKPEDRDSCDSVINKMGKQITKFVLSNKFNVFRADARRREIIVTPPRTDSNGKYYVELRLKEGHDSYYIRERSLGFRWLFAFLLFTQFRVSRLNSDKNLFFLLDEPASNLHQSAQRRLMSALDDITGQTQASVILATHSHHMINPNWLESTFIVSNVGLNYENEDDYISSMTNIKIERYRNFVASNPGLTNYYQPILDVLEYKPSNLEYIQNVVLVEGKNDYYNLSYMKDIVLKVKGKIGLCPGNGSGSMDAVIRLYYAWGKDFVILLDADSEGQSQKKRYLDVFGPIARDRVYCLSDIDNSWEKMGMEKLFDANDRLIMQQTIFPQTASYQKKMFNVAVQELLVTKKAVILNPSTCENFTAVLNFLIQKVGG